MAARGRSRFVHDTAAVARDLLGWRLVRVRPDGARESGRVVETEAYPPGDPSSHARRGPTPRCAPMFGRAATAYIYLIYGMYWCLNVVTEPEGVGAAVLIRGLDSIDGCAGPGRLCARLGIDASLNGVDLLDPAAPLHLVRARALPPEPVVVTTRIGITRAADLPMRFYLAGSLGVSRK
jgi:DNA-3-methyladenine glycosylase